MACKIITGLQDDTQDSIKEIEILKQSKNEFIIEYIGHFYENRLNVCILTRFYKVYYIKKYDF